MARTTWQPGIYSLNNIDTGVSIECTVDNKKIFVPPGSSLTVVARNYISRDDTLVKLEINYIGLICDEGKLSISGNITAGT
mgnify:CR=1 FL=1|tara:strand:- start:362 stop:604 length:243 start_codon:yes stop_codon:yes gene_type:complete